MVTQTVRVGDKGRVVIPANLRQAAGGATGDELVMRAQDGSIVLETRAAIKARVRAEARAAGAPAGAVERLLADRAADLALEEPADRRRRLEAAAVPISRKRRG